MLLTSTTTVALSPGVELGDRARLAPVAREVLEQVADRAQPERLGGSLRPSHPRVRALAQP